MNKTSRKVFAWVGMIVVITALFSACGKAEQEQTPPTGNQNISQQADPKEDDTLNILMIGNSFSYYFPDELYGMLKAAGIKARVCNVYYPGCTLQQHWGMWKNGENRYSLFTIDENGRREKVGFTLDYCLLDQNWDVISLQEGSTILRKAETFNALSNFSVYRNELLEHLQKKFPDAEIYWHQTWAYQVGFDQDGYRVDRQEQEAYAERQREYALAVCRQFDMGRIPSGDAWQLARGNPVVGDNLCARLSENNGEGDYYHDGDIGGGQYLNACVWFEVLTGQSCIGNTFRPDGYTLSEELVAALQQAAHEAVQSIGAE